MDAIHKDFTPNADGIYDRAEVSQPIACDLVAGKITVQLIYSKRVGNTKIHDYGTGTLMLTNEQQESAAQAIELALAPILQAAINDLQHATN